MRTKMLLLRKIFSLIFILICCKGFAQENIITNISSRQCTSLNGNWQYLIDPYGTGFYDYRFKERKENDLEAYWNTDKPINKTDRKEFGFSDKYLLKVPGDWNSQDPRFLYYEGIVWYKKTFDYLKKDEQHQVFIYFGAINYRADIYLNGKKIGTHVGGFTSFNVEVPDFILKEKENNLVVKVDNTRHADAIPTLNTDWWNYGGITRDVTLLELPKESSIINYSVSLKNSESTTANLVCGNVQLLNAKDGEKVIIAIPELNVKEQFNILNNNALIRFRLPQFLQWSPEHPKLYTVLISSKSSTVTERIGFRTIQVKGDKIVLNNQPVFLRGISIHEEIAEGMRRAYNHHDALKLLTYAKELGCNMVRLAHYPHNEYMTRLADSLGLLVWSEIPVYWTIDFKSPEVLANAKHQLHEMIARDHNRASVIIWSVGNETPVSEARNIFMKSLLQTAKAEDSSRLVSAALEVNYQSENDSRTIDDPLGEFTDIVAFNEYLGWYGGTPEKCRNASFSTKYHKPLFISETGAEALGGYHADSLTVFSEEYQEWYFKEQVALFKRMPENFSGVSPWILVDFRSPRRNNPQFEDGWNNKGLIDQKGRKKMSFTIIKNYYESIKTKNP